MNILTEVCLLHNELPPPTPTNRSRVKPVWKHTNMWNYRSPDCAPTPAGAHAYTQAHENRHTLTCTHTL